MSKKNLTEEQEAQSTSWNIFNLIMCGRAARRLGKRRKGAEIVGNRRSKKEARWREKRTEDKRMTQGARINTLRCDNIGKER